jgi:hypothetical protein
MPQTHLTDRQRVELLIPSLLLQAAVRDARAADGGRDPEAADVCNTCLLDLEEAIKALLPRDRADKLRRRGRRIERRALGPVRGADFGAFVLAIRLLIERLIADGHIELHAGSPFDRAWERFTDALAASPDADKLDSPDRRGEADRLCRAMRQALAEQGYYRTEEAAQA